jgi:hypothetical protein
MAHAGCDSRHPSRWYCQRSCASRGRTCLERRRMGATWSCRPRGGVPNAFGVVETGLKGERCTLDGSASKRRYLPRRTRRTSCSTTTRHQSCGGFSTMELERLASEELRLPLRSTRSDLPATLGACRFSSISKKSMSMRAVFRASAQRSTSLLARLRDSLSGGSGRSCVSRMARCLKRASRPSRSAAGQALKRLYAGRVASGRLDPCAHSHRRARGKLTAPAIRF